MLKLIATITLFVASLVAFASGPKTDLVLLSTITSDTADGTPVVLQSPDGTRCKYLGTLQSHVRKDIGVTEKALTSVLGNRDRSISVTSKECAGVVVAVAISIPPGRMQPGPEAGTRFSVVLPN